MLLLGKRWFGVFNINLEFMCWRGLIGIMSFVVVLRLDGFFLCIFVYLGVCGIVVVGVFFGEVLRFSERLFL